MILSWCDLRGLLDARDGRYSGGAHVDGVAVLDRQRLGDSMEAWIHVVGVAYVTPDGQPVADPARGQWSLVGFRGVLTWENSD